MGLTLEPVSKSNVNLIQLFPYPVVVDAFTTGTLFINIFDPEQVGTEERTIPMVWLGAVNGLLEGSASGLQARITQGIDQLFDQSPYLAQ